MQRIMTSTRALDLFGPGMDGFTDGAIVGAPPTQLEARFFNLVQEEISRLIESAGIVLDETRYDQMTLAIQQMIDDQVQPILGNYLPLTAGPTVPLTGPLYARGDDGFGNAIIADLVGGGGGNIYGNALYIETGATVIGAASVGTTFTVGGNITAGTSIAAGTSLSAGADLFVATTSNLIGKVTVSAVSDFGAGAVAGIEIATATEPALAFHRVGVTAVKMGIDGLNRFVIGGWSFSPGTLVLDTAGSLSVLGNFYAGGQSAAAGLISAGTSVHAVTSMHAGTGFYTASTVQGGFLQSLGDASIAGNMSAGLQVFGNTVVGNGISSNSYINALAGTITGANVTANAQCYGATVVSGGQMTCNGNMNTVGNITAGAQVSGNTVVANGITSNGNIGAVAQVSGATVVATGLITGAGLRISLFGNGISYPYGNNQSPLGFSYNGATTNCAFMVNGASIGVIQINPSDERLKRNITPARGDALAELNGLQMISYDLPSPTDPDLPPVHFDCGFSANQMEAIIPEAVVSLPVSEDDEQMLSLNSLPLIARCVGAIQQLTKRLEALEGARR